MPFPIGKAIRLAASPSGRKTIGQAMRVARTEEGRKLIAQAQRVARSPEGRKLIQDAVSAAKRAGETPAPESKERLATLRRRLLTPKP